MMRMPEKVTSTSSPWYEYLKVVYRATGDLPLPLKLKQFEAFYPALLPVPPCTKDAHYLLPEERRWHAAWRAAFAAFSASRSEPSPRAVPHCAASVCSAWLPKPKPRDADIIAFTSGRSYVRVAAQNASDFRPFGHVVILQRRAGARMAHGQVMTPSKLHSRVAVPKPAPETQLPRAGEWAEVSRTAFPGEGTRGCELSVPGLEPAAESRCARVRMSPYR